MLKLGKLVTIEAQKGHYVVKSIKGNIFKFVKCGGSDYLHFTIKDGKHRKIAII